LEATDSIVGSARFVWRGHDEDPTTLDPAHPAVRRTHPCWL